MNYSSTMSSVERRSQSNPLQIQNHETRGESSNQIHERNSTQIQPQSRSVSVSEDDQTSRTLRESALGKRSLSDMLVSPNNQIIMPVNDRMNVMRPTMEMSSDGRNLLTSISVPEQQLRQPFQAITSQQQPFQVINVADLVNDGSGRHNTHTPSSVIMNQMPNQAPIIPSGMSERYQQLPQPSQEALEMSMPRHHSYHNMFQQNSGQPAYPGNQRVNNPADIAAGSSRRTFHLPPLSAHAKQEIVNKFQAWRAAQGLMLQDNDDPSSQRAIIAHQDPTQHADDPLIGRFSSLIAVTQRHGLDKGKQQSMSSDQVPHSRGMVLGRTDPLVAWPLHHSSTTDQMMMMPYPISSATTLKTIQFITGEGPSEARKTLELMSTAGEGMHECRIVYGDGREGISCFTLPTKDQVDGFTKQFSALMAREGFRLADPQFDDFVEMVEQRLSRSEDFQSRQLDKTAISHANAPQGMMMAEEPLFISVAPYTSGASNGKTVSCQPAGGTIIISRLFDNKPDPNPSSPELPLPPEHRGEPYHASPHILIPYAGRIQPVPALRVPLAEPIRLPPIPSEKTPCIIPLRAAAKLISLAANESNSSQLMQQLPWILDKNI